MAEEFDRKWIACLFIFLGLTVGMLSALSLTSTSNTVIHLLASLVAGSGGAYFLLKINAYTYPLIKGISQLGLLLLGSFWIGLIVVDSIQWYQQKQISKVDSLSLSAQVLITEVQAHARLLGVSESQLTRQITDAIDASGSGGCNHSISVAPDILDFIKSLSNAHEACGVQEDYSTAVVNWNTTAMEILKDFRSDDQKMISRAGIEFWALQRSVHSQRTETGNELKISLCEKDKSQIDARPSKSETTVLSYLDRCFVNDLSILAASYRRAATEVSSRWETPVPIKKAIIKQESLRP